MHIFILFGLFLLASSVKCRGIWDLIGDLFDKNIYQVPEDARLSIAELANKYGYKFEEHTVITEDGYILNFHRIPESKDGLRNGLVVFLMHGILDSSDSWLLQGVNKSLAYVLADQGYDVWMGNSRGNKHCPDHSSSDSAEDYWKFTWEEIALYDLSAMIDYVLNSTGKDSLYYVGHSQGTTVGYVLLSMKPEYNKAIKIMFSLAPEAWMGHVRSPIIRLFSSTVNFLGSFVIDIASYTSGTEFFAKISPYICTLLPLNCDNLMYAMTGYETKINETLFPIIFGHMPTGSSMLQFVHYGQLVNSRRFCRYDFGLVKNMEMYGMTIPPEYDLKNITAPVVLFYSNKDWLSHPLDVEILRNQLSNVIDNVFCSDFAHMDYVYAEEARTVIYDKIIARIQSPESDYLSYRVLRTLKIR